jgi:hypothetical protein
MNQLATDIARLFDLTRDQLRREIGHAELAATLQPETPERLAYRAQLEKRAILLDIVSITGQQMEGWACIFCGISAGSDVWMEAVSNVVVDGESWTVFAHPVCLAGEDVDAEGTAS